MKYSTIVLFSASTILHAGTPETIAPAPEKPAAWITPLIDIRARYEFADVDGRDVSHAFTTRERLGLKTAAWHGFSGLIEGEFTQALIDDYTSGAPGADPLVPGNSVISDPETNELNQAYLQYSAFETTVRLGRQRIIYDNAAFIGNVGWRQNEQTYDALSFSTTLIDNLTLNYAYVERVNRIFGSEAIGTFKSVTGDIHLLNATFTGTKGTTLGAYAYLMDFNAPVGWNNDTFGASVKTTAAGLALYGELAWQDEAGAANNSDAIYAHATATKALGTHSLTLGVEHLGAGFQTPLATVHAFNGFADVFIGQRINGTLPGLTDVYLSHTMPIFFGMKWTNVLHAYGDNSLSTDLGWEFDSVLVKKFNDNFTAIAKLAHFETESAIPTTTRFSVELNYTF